MKRANPAQLRQSLEVASVTKSHQEHFVCMPVAYQDNGVDLLKNARESLERMALIAEAAEQRT